MIVNFPAWLSTNIYKKFHLYLITSSISELIYELAINRRLLPSDQHSALMQLLEKYAFHAAQVSESNFQKAAPIIDSDPDLRSSASRMAIGKKYLNIFRAIVFINLSDSSPEAYKQSEFLNTAKSELLLSILICQAQADQFLDPEMLEQLSSEQLCELSTVYNVHQLVKNFRRHRLIDHTETISEPELITTSIFKSLQDVDVLFEEISNLKNLPQRTS
ncbi:MAG: hypothetical protein ACRCZE_04020 [Candidatus Altimarinota bacterium]